MHHLLPIISVFKWVHTSVLYAPLQDDSCIAVKTLGFNFNQSWLVKFGNSESWRCGSTRLLFCPLLRTCTFAAVFAVWLGCNNLEMVTSVRSHLCWTKTLHEAWPGGPLPQSAPPPWAHSVLVSQTYQLQNSGRRANTWASTRGTKATIQRLHWQQQLPPPFCPGTNQLESAEDTDQPTCLDSLRGIPPHVCHLKLVTTSPWLLNPYTLKLGTVCVFGAGGGRWRNPMTE